MFRHLIVPDKTCDQSNLPFARRSITTATVDSRGLSLGAAPGYDGWAEECGASRQRQLGLRGAAGGLDSLGVAEKTVDRF